MVVWRRRPKPPVIVLSDQGSQYGSDDIVGADEPGNSFHPLFRKPFLPQDKHRAENQTDSGSRFGQKPIRKAGGKDYRRKSTRKPAPTG